MAEKSTEVYWQKKRYTTEGALLIILRTILRAVDNINRSLVRFCKDSAMRRAEEDDERLLSLDGGVLDVIHDGQTTGLGEIDT